MTAEAFFLPADDGVTGQRFCLYHPAQLVHALGAIVYVHPFAEEMNKSRRMAALQSRAFAAAGYAVLQIDLYGCGDSSGDFADASWDRWVGDVSQAVHWLRSREPAAPLWLWGLRAGCLLAAAASKNLRLPHNLLFWQPMTSGKLLLGQFLRLKLVANMLGGQQKGAIEALRAQLATNVPEEIGGYVLAPKLASALEQVAAAPTQHAKRLEWIEVATRSAATLLPASVTHLSLWRESGCAVRTQVAEGLAFWQTVEIEDAPALLVATLAAVDGTTLLPMATADRVSVSA
jgi:uncharacterized protein